MGARLKHSNGVYPRSFIDFRVKSVAPAKDGSGDVVIEGWANYARVDRMKEVIAPDAWDLEDYLKNPIVLYNHGKDPNYGFIPVGRCLMIKPTENGLYAKVVLSNSMDPKIKVIRDLVQEGILKSFSVGFDPVEEAEDGNGVNVVTSAKLLELSIVTLPMQQDSTFSLSAKDYNEMKTKMTAQALRTKGAWVASAVQQRIYQLQQSHGDFNRDRALQEIGDKAGVRLDDVRNVLAGEVTPVPKEMISAFAQVLGLDEANLTKLDKGDTSVAKRQATAGGARQFGANQKGVALPPLRPDGPTDWTAVMERAPKPQADVPPAKKNEPGPDAVAEGDEEETQPVWNKDAVDGDPDADEIKQPANADAAPEHGKDSAPLGTGEPDTENEDSRLDPTDASDGQEPDVGVQAIVVPKEVVENIQDATTWVKEHGWIVDDVNQSNEAFYFVQHDPSGFDPDSFYMIDLGGGVWAQVGARSSHEASGTPPIDAQAEAKMEEAAHNDDKKPQTQASPHDMGGGGAKAGEEAHNTGAKEPKKQPAAKPAQSAPHLAGKDGAAAGAGGGAPGSGSGGSIGSGAETVPFAEPQGPGPWTSHKKPPPKKPTVNVDPHTGKARQKTAEEKQDPNADNQTGQPLDGEELDEHQEKVKAGTACAGCMSDSMAKCAAEGKPHDQAVAIAIDKCKDVCPTQPAKDYAGPVYSPDQLRAFTDGWKTAYEKFVSQESGTEHDGAGENRKAAAGSKRIKQGTMDPSPTSTIGAGGTQDPTLGMDDNPYLLGVKQTNALLGSLITEIQAMSKKLDGLVQHETNEATEQPTQNGLKPPVPKPSVAPQGGVEPGMSKALENLSGYVRDLNLRLKKLGA